VRPRARCRDRRNDRRPSWSSPGGVGPDAPEPALILSPDKACFIIVKAREFDAKETETDADADSNPADDRAIDVLEDSADDPVVED
jgi:hypothetical protein